MNPKSGVLLVIAALVAACSGTAVPTSAPTPPSSPAGPFPSPTTTVPAPRPSGDTINGLFTVDGRTMFLACVGAGSPTVILEAGLGGHSGTWTGMVAGFQPTTRVCSYDRAGLGKSQAHTGAGDLSAGDRANDLHSLLDVAGVDGPYVLVGFSYGGMIVRTFTARFPEEVAGLLFVDSTHEDAWKPGGWILEHAPLGRDGAHAVDVDRTLAELRAATDVGDRPIIVLTQGSMSGEFERQWTPIQDKIAALSSKSLHMVATESDHVIPEKRPSLIAESILAVVAATGGTPLPECGPRFEALGAECLAGTMADLLATWDARRDAVVPAAGDLPAGTYTFKEDDVTITMTIDGGRLAVKMTGDDGVVEAFTAEYAAIGDRVTFLWPFDWRFPRTPGVNLARWTADPDGTLHFEQLDAEQRESWIAVPWIPAPGS